MAAVDYRQDYSWTKFSPLDNTGTQRSIFRSAYKNLRFVLDLQTIIVLNSTQSSNLPGLSYQLYKTVDFWRVLLAYNGLQDPIQDVFAGMRFRVPTKTSIVRWMSQQQDNQAPTMVI